MGMWEVLSLNPYREEKEQKFLKIQLKIKSIIL